MMTGDTDILAVLADVVGTPDPIGLIQALEEKGVTVSATDPHFSPDEQRAQMAEFEASMAPMWAQANETRLRLVGEGWSEEMAEHLASHIAHMWIGNIESQMQGNITVDVAERIALAQKGISDD